MHLTLHVSSLLQGLGLGTLVTKIINKEGSGKNK